jgi:hypothetical protein
MRKKPVSSHLLNFLFRANARGFEKCWPNFHQNDRGGV